MAVSTPRISDIAAVVHLRHNTYESHAQLIKTVPFHIEVVPFHI